MSNPDEWNMSEMVDKLLKEDKITVRQASQFRLWEAAKPDPKADTARFEEWLKSKPDIPGLEPPYRPMADTIDKLITDGKISQMQAAQFKMWESVMPDKNIAPQKFEAWLKQRPDIPGLPTLQ